MIDIITFESFAGAGLNGSVCVCLVKFLLLEPFA
jgi:hypothetical protein